MVCCFSAVGFLADSTVFPKHKKFPIYLAGPISGCNHTQVHAWRNAVKRLYRKQLYRPK